MKHLLSQRFDVTDAGAKHILMFTENVRFNLLICGDRRNYHAIKSGNEWGGGSGGVEYARLEINRITKVLYITKNANIFKFIKKYII